MSSTVFLKNNVSGQCCSENQNTHIIFNNFFENSPLWDNVWKNGIARLVADENAIFGELIEKDSSICLFILNNNQTIPISSEKFFKYIFSIT
jgi:hypothetical protein